MYISNCFLTVAALPKNFLSWSHIAVEITHRVVEFILISKNIIYSSIFLMKIVLVFAFSYKDQFLELKNELSASYIYIFLELDWYESGLFPVF